MVIFAKYKFEILVKLKTLLILIKIMIVYIKLGRTRSKIDGGLSFEKKNCVKIKVDNFFDIFNLFENQLL